jgi:hypothetical protein
MKAVPIDQRKSIEPIKQNQSERPNLSSLIDNHKNVPAADHIPIAALPIPVAVPVRVPVGVIPVGIGVNSRAIVRMDNGAIVGVNRSSVSPCGMISTIGATDSRATSGVDRCPVTGLDCRASTVMSYFTVFPLVGIRVQSGG